MRVASYALTIGAVALSAGLLTASVQAMDEHKIVAPDDIQWGPAPPTLPPGAQAAVLYGNPAQDGLFALRLRFPAGYHVPPHTHPKPEVITVLSGNFKLGAGETAEPTKAQALGPGTLFAMPSGMAHYAYTDEETVVQLNSVGPFGISYVNPQDDPRPKTQ